MAKGRHLKENIVRALGCQIGDIVEYVPDPEA